MTTTVLDPVLTPEIVRAPTIEPTPDPQPPIPRLHPANLLTLPAAYIPDDAPRQNLRVRLDLYDEAIFRTVYEAGQAVSYDEVLCLDMGRVFATADMDPQRQLLPPGALWCYRGQHYHIGIYLPPKVRELYLDGEEQPLRVPLPPLIFCGHGTSYSIFALAGDGWPGPETQLYHAPFSNVYQGVLAMKAEAGDICHGSVEFPVCAPDTILAAAELFFTSRFNNDLSRNKSRVHESIIGQWRALAAAGLMEYPLGDLVSIEKTLKELL